MCAGDAWSSDGVMGRRRGTSIVEVLVALLLGLFVVHLGLTTMLRLDRFEDRAARRQDALLATRIARTVLRGELARGQPGHDWSVGRDSLALRAFRGTGVVCTVGPVSGQLLVAYSGDRQPDPSKDSVEITSTDGTMLVTALASSAGSSATCPVATAGETIHEWTVDTVVAQGALTARLFESGVYHLAGSALRYRIGGGGRQPLTPQVWRDAATTLTSVDSVVVLELSPRERLGTGSREFLAWLGR